MSMIGPDAPASSGTQLVLFTNGFPYDTGEEFLETEIGALAEAYGTVFVVPLTDPARSASRRALPGNVVVIEPRYERQAHGRILLEYAVKHPLRALRSTARTLRNARGLNAIVADLKFDLVAELVADRTLPRLRRVLAPGADTIFYAYWLHAPAQVALATRDRLRLRAVPVVSRAHRYDLYDDQASGGSLPGRAQLLRRLAAVFPVSEHGRRFLADRFPAHAGKISVERLGVFPAQHAGNPRLDSATLYSCSSVIPVKRVPLLVEGIAAAQRRGVEVNWVHIGTGPASEVARLEETAARLLAPGSYTLAGALSNAQVRERYRDAPGTAFINVSASEGVPVSLMEALAQGLPVIATDVGGSAELIDTARGMFAGLLPADPDPERIADLIETVFGAAPEAYGSWVGASIAHWERAWSAEANYSAFCRRISSLAGRS